MTVQDQIGYIIDAFEGGDEERRRPYASFSNDPNDHGGATRWGITRALLSEYLGLPPGALCPVERVHELTRDEAIAVGTEMFARRPRIERIAADRLRFVTLDYAFHSGAGQAVKDLQRALGLPVADGDFGPHTEAAATAVADVDVACEQLVAHRLAFIGQDLDHHHDQAEWALGWLTRVGQVLCYRVP